MTDVRSRSLAALIVIAALGTTAGASPLSDALARNGAAELAALRAHRDDSAARCTLGAIAPSSPRSASICGDRRRATLPTIASRIAMPEARPL
jgi:hypothetical protein